MMKILVLILCLHLISSEPFKSNNNNKAASINEKKCSAKNCALPLCHCSSTKAPGDIESDKLPQMIGLSFNGVIHDKHMKFIKKILNPIFKNPHGCSIQATFFVSGPDDDHHHYCNIRNLFNNNNEIGIGSIEYNCPYSDCDLLGNYIRKWDKDSVHKTISIQKNLISKKSMINKSFLKGFRLPHMDQKGDLHMSVLKRYFFSYDSSVLIKPIDIKNNNGLRFWPHTLNFEPNYTCTTCPSRELLCENNQKDCPLNSLWVIPLHYLNAEDFNPCPFLLKIENMERLSELKDCIPLDKTTQKVIENQLMKNFLHHYQTNKAPFVLNIETEWFDIHGDILTDALVKFINDLTSASSELASRKDIYFVPLSKIVEWMQEPLTLDELNSRWLWDCVDHEYDYDSECERSRHNKKGDEQNSQSDEELAVERKLNATIEKQGINPEPLFQSGVFTGVVVCFTLSIIFIIFYDKYN